MANGRRRRPTRRRPAARLGAGVLALMLPMSGPALGAEQGTTAFAGASRGPQRVVSLNLCTDQLAVQLLDRERIASVSALADDPTYSAVVEEVQDLPQNYGRAEEVLRHRPDLVMASAFGKRSTVRLLRRLDIPVLQIGPPRSLTDVRRQIRRVARALGVPQRGRALIERLDARLAAAKPPVDQRGRVTAAVYEPNGVTVGRNELPHAAVTAAGLSNLAAKLGLTGLVPLPLERLVVARPDVLILQTEQTPAPSQATALLEHPALRRLARESVVIRIPRRLWTCAGPQVADAVRRLARARREAR